MTKNLTARDFLRIHASDILNEGQAHVRGQSERPALSETERYAQVCQARRVRNFWFTSAPVGSRANAGNLSELTGVSYRDSITPRFGEPVIITDILSLFEYRLSKIGTTGNSEGWQLVSVQQYGGQGNAYGRDFFETSSPTFSWLTLKHERSHRRITIGAGPAGRVYDDLMDKFMAFPPHLLRPYETLLFRYYIPDRYLSSPLQHCGFRAVRVLPAGSPYAELSALADRQVRSYIKGSSPDTFLMEIKIPLADLGAISTGSVAVRTEQQDRPCILITVNVNLTR